MEFDKKIKLIDDQMEDKKQKIRNLGGKKKETLEGGKVSGSSLTFKEFLKERVEDLKIVRDKKKELFQAKDIIQNGITHLDNEKIQLLKSLPS